MKKIGLIILASFCSLFALAQTTEYKKLPSFGIHFTMNDFNSAGYVRANGLASLMDEGGLWRFKDHAPGMAFSFMNGITPHIDFGTTIGGSFPSYVVPGKNSKSERLLLEGVAEAHFKLLTDRYILNPFLSLGVGGAKYGPHFNAVVPVGAGLQIRVAEDHFVMFKSQYRIPASQLGEYHFYHSLGVVAPLKKRVVEPVIPPTPPVVDRDNDGVLDSLDRCPDVAGLAALNGCPDRDGDGIADIDDKCPDVAGVAKYNGCPIPDTDGDGINDDEDKCPTVAGLARYQGCPIPDTDGDGVNDEEDKCPTVAGTAANFGCPEIKKEVIEKVSFAARNVFYSTGSYKLLSKSFKPLNDVANLMKADTTLRLAIEGHTDSQGADDMNQKLSENRANSVKEYLVSKGVPADRLTTTGYGETKPVADNNTAAGRAKNRRTEMIVTNY